MTSLRAALRPTIRRAFASYYFVRNRVFRPALLLAIAGGCAVRHRLTRQSLAASCRRLQQIVLRRPVLVLPLDPELMAGHAIGSKARGRQVVMLVVSDLRVDPRVEREARALAAGGYKVRVLCPDLTLGIGDPLRLDWGRNVAFKILPKSAGSFILSRPGYLGAEMCQYAGRYRPFAFHAHDLNTSYVALAAARHTGAHLVVDFHEWTSENVHWDANADCWAPYPDDWKEQLRALEVRLLREASAVITVSESIAEAMAEELGDGRRPELVRNIPALSAVPTRDYLPLKQQLGLAEDRFVLLYQGGTGRTRMLEPIIEALAFAPACTLVIRGPSLDLFGADYMAIARRIGAADRLILLPPVPSRDVVATARGADAGIYSVVGLCRNFTYALPNKLFEYIAAGLPVLTAHYPEARRMVETHQVGLVFDPTDPRSIAAAINRLIEQPDFAAALRRNTITALTALDAEHEWHRLVGIYDRLSRARRGAW